MNKTIGIIIVVAVLVIGGIYLLTRTPSAPGSEEALSEQNQNQAVAEGRVVFSVTDAAANLSTISEINMMVKSVEVHSSASGWMTVSTTPRVYNLLVLNAENRSELLADANIKAGTYDQIRLMVDSISVKTKTGAVKEAKLPSGELKINTRLVVNANETSSANFDFLADKSLHVTGNGSYIFAPVVKFETRSSADVSVSVDSTVKITGGRSDDQNTVGMDVDGTIKLNFQISGNQKLNIDGNGIIKLEGLLQ